MFFPNELEKELWVRETMNTADKNQDGQIDASEYTHLVSEVEELEHGDDVNLPLNLEKLRDLIAPFYT